MILSWCAKTKFILLIEVSSNQGFNDVTCRTRDRCKSNFYHNIASSVLYFTSAREISTKLEERYGQTSGTQLFETQQAGFVLNQTGKR